MKKIELEKLLMRPERVAILNERAAYLKNKYGENGTTAGEAAEKVSHINLKPHERIQTGPEIIKNDEDFTCRSEFITDVTRFIGDFKEADPRALLKTLTKKYLKKASLSQQLIVENLINNITSMSEPNRDDEIIIEDAINLLTKMGKEPGGNREEVKK